MATPNPRTANRATASHCHADQPPDELAGAVAVSVPDGLGDAVALLAGGEVEPVAGPPVPPPVADAGAVLVAAGPDVGPGLELGLELGLDAGAARSKRS